MGWDWQAGRGEARIGVVWSSRAWSGWEWQARYSQARHGQDGYGRRGIARRSEARPGRVRSGTAGLARRAMVGIGRAWQGVARRGRNGKETVAMHAGSLTGDSAAARVYRRLRASPGEWQSAWDLTLDCRTTAISTRVSEVRHQLDDSWEVESLYRDGHWYYRLVRREVMEPMLC